MGTIVQKFGGTSVARPDLREMVISHIRTSRANGNSTVVVVSAMGRAGDVYATDTLLGLIGLGSDRGVDDRDVDLLLCCGEIISTVVMANALCKVGLPAVALTGAQAGIITDSNYGDAHILEVDTDRLKAEFALGRIPVVAGFQGATIEGEFTTLGRGGSDTTAAAIGVALRADVVEIFTDVEGVMTADPRLVDSAKVLDCLTYREVAEMAHMGAKVIHPRAVEIAMEGRVPIKVRCTMTNAPGTLITDNTGPIEAVTIRGDRVVTGIASIAKMALVTLRKTDNPTAQRVFRGMAEVGVSVDLISISQDAVSFIIKESDVDDAKHAIVSLGLVGELEGGFAKVSAVGAGMRGIPGVMASVVDALDALGISIFQTTDSHTTISCLVRQDDMSAAVKALHDKFGLG